MYIEVTKGIYRLLKRCYLRIISCLKARPLTIIAPPTDIYLIVNNLQW